MTVAILRAVLSFCVYWMCALSGSLHNCSTLIESRLARKDSPTLPFAPRRPHSLDCDSPHGTDSAHVDKSTIGPGRKRLTLAR
jgi:hypothetical protein